MVDNKMSYFKPPSNIHAAIGLHRYVVSDLNFVKTREVIECVDWPFEVETLLRNQDLGCGALSSALTWFFGHEGEGIILKDDRRLSETFFWSCGGLLEQYRHDIRIMHIGGNDFQNECRFDDYSCFFAAFGQVWRWSAWVRAWRACDFRMRDFLKIIGQGYFDYFLPSVS